MTTAGFDESAELRDARLLGEVVHERIRVAALQHQGLHFEASQIAGELLIRLLEGLSIAGPAEFDKAQAPRVMQGVALLADNGFSSLLAGDSAAAAQRLRALANFSRRLEGLADQFEGMGMLHCKDGRPSLDGSCIQIPPCPS